MKLGAIEAGGTKFVVCIGDEFGNVIERDSFPTETPEETMANIFKVLGETHRIEILRILYHAGRELTCSEVFKGTL